MESVIKAVSMLHAQKYAREPYSVDTNALLSTHVLAAAHHAQGSVLMHACILSVVVPASTRVSHVSVNVNGDAITSSVPRNVVSRVIERDATDHVKKN